MMSYLLQYFYCDWQLWFCRAEVERIMHKSRPVLVLPLCFFFPFLLESFHSDRARRDLDREPKVYTDKHTLTCPPVAACHWHILCCQSAAEAADNSCYFTLVAPGWNSFIPLTDSLLSPLVFIWMNSASFDSFLLRSPFLLRYASLTQWTPLPIATQQWQTDCTPLGAGGGFYKLNWTQKQLKTRAKKMDLCAVLNAWPPLEIHFL